MVEGVIILRCGGCGSATVKLYRKNPQMLIAECTDCRSLTEIRVTPAQILLSWSEEGPKIGCLTEWPKNSCLQIYTNRL